MGFSPAMKINKAETNKANVKFTRGTIKFDTHQGTLDLSTAATIMQPPPLIVLTLYR